MDTWTARVEFNGRLYLVEFNEARANEALVFACHVRRIRKDGSLGAKLTGINEIYACLKLARASRC